MGCYTAKASGGANRLVLGSTNTFVGDIVVQQGRVQLNVPGTLATNNLTVNAGTDVRVWGGDQVLNSLNGGGGHDMLKSFDVKYLGTEKLGDVDTVKLDLVPKSQKVRNTFQHIVLWIDPTRGVSVQQQFFDPSGDYRLAKYTEIELNQKIPDAVFKLKTTGKTKFVRPQG